MPRYRIPIQKDLIKQLVSNAKIDEDNNNCLRLQGDYSQGFVKGIEAHESEKIDFKKLKGFVWTKPMRLLPSYESTVIVVHAKQLEVAISSNIKLS
jgi:hypothetical protein